MIAVNKNIPTSTLLEIKINDQIDNGEGKFGIVSAVKINETDEYLMFLFSLSNGSEIEIRKLKQIC